jgi:hypothetical protein
MYGTVGITPVHSRKILTKGEHMCHELHQVSHHGFFINPGGFGYEVTQQRHQFPNFPEISLISLNIHILYTILKDRASSFTQISHEELKISQKTNRNENLQYL